MRKTCRGRRGRPEFRLDEDAVVFLEQNAFGDYSVVAGEQGTFRLWREINGETKVTQDSAELPLMDARTKEFARSGICGMPLSSFSKIIKDSMLERSYG